MPQATSKVAAISTNTRWRRLKPTMAWNMPPPQPEMGGGGPLCSGFMRPVPSRPHAPRRAGVRHAATS